MKPQLRTLTNPLKYTDPTGYQRTSLGGASNWLGGGGGMGESGTGFSDNVNWNYFDAQNHYINPEGVSVAYNDDPPVDLNQEAILYALWEGIQNNEVFAIHGETDIKNIYEEMVAGMNFRIINAFGRLTLVSKFGDFGKITVDPSGAISSTNLGGAHLADAVVKGSAGGGELTDDLFSNSEIATLGLAATGGSVQVTTELINRLSGAVKNADVVNFGKSVTKKFGFVGVGLTIYSVSSDGTLSAGDGARILLSGATFIPYVGWAYGAVDIGVLMVTGTSVTDRVGVFIDEHWGPCPIRP